MSKWFWKTLKGYKTMYISTDREVTFVHRPFREPIMVSKRLDPKSMRGMRYDSIIIDEIVND